MPISSTNYILTSTVNDPRLTYCHWKNEPDHSYSYAKAITETIATIADRLSVRKIIRNGPATIVFWEDDTKTIVMRKKGEKDDPYYAFCAALTKKVYGTNSHIKKVLGEVTEETTKKKSKKA